MHFVGSFGTVEGRGGAEAAKKFVALFSRLEIREGLHRESRVVLMYDIKYLDPIGVCVWRP